MLTLVADGGRTVVLVANNINLNKNIWKHSSKKKVGKKVLAAKSNASTLTTDDLELHSTASLDRRSRI